MNDLVGRFGPRDGVRVRFAQGSGHTRTPHYVQGKIGWVEAARGAFRNPEQRAHGGDGLPAIPLYTVGFHQMQVWERYDGSSMDTLYVDLYEHWLEPEPAGVTAR